MYITDVSDELSVTVFHEGLPSRTKGTSPLPFTLYKRELDLPLLKNTTPKRAPLKRKRSSLKENTAPQNNVMQSSQQFPTKRLKNDVSSIVFSENSKVTSDATSLLRKSPLKSIDSLRQTKVSLNKNVDKNSDILVNRQPLNTDLLPKTPESSRSPSPLSTISNSDEDEIEESKRNADENVNDDKQSDDSESQSDTNDSSDDNNDARNGDNDADSDDSEAENDDNDKDGDDDDNKSVSSISLSSSSVSPTSSSSSSSESSNSSDSSESDDEEDDVEDKNIVLNNNKEKEDVGLKHNENEGKMLTKPKVVAETTVLKEETKMEVNEEREDKNETKNSTSCDQEEKLKLKNKENIKKGRTTKSGEKAKPSEAMKCKSRDAKNNTEDRHLGM